MTSNSVRMLPSLRNHLLFSGRTTWAELEKVWKLSSSLEIIRGIPAKVIDLYRHFYDEVAKFKEKISRYLEHFGKEHVLVLDHKTFITVPQTSTLSGMHFIGVLPIRRAEAPLVNTARAHLFLRTSGSLRRALNNLMSCYMVRPVSVTKAEGIRTHNDTVDR